MQTLTPNFTVVALQKWAYGAKITKIVTFWYKFAQKGYIPLSNFLYKIWCGGGSSRFAPSCQISSLWLQKCGFTARQITKNANFWYKFAPKGKFRKSTEKIEYRCSTTNLPLCNDTIIVLEITLLNSVSVITNFVIPKRDRQ